MQFLTTKVQFSLDFISYGSRFHPGFRQYSPEVPQVWNLELGSGNLVKLMHRGFSSLRNVSLGFRSTAKVENY